MPMGCLEISPVSDQVAASPAVVRPVKEKSGEVKVSTRPSQISEKPASGVRPADSMACLMASMQS